MGIREWGLGIREWGIGIGDWRDMYMVGILGFKLKINRQNLD
jgi:hypothetical protein